MKTLQPFAGIIVGDLGEKCGMNGLDNGFIMFNNYRIPKKFLLARTGDVTDDGQYMSPIKNNKKRIGASFGALSGGRVDICGKFDLQEVEGGRLVQVKHKKNRVQIFQEFPIRTWSKP